MALPASSTGGCLCGAVRYTLSEAPRAFGACHCSMCRKFSGGIQLGLETTLDAITWTGHETIAVYRSSDWAERGFCRICGSSLFWRLTATGAAQGMMALCAGTLDDLDALEFTNEVYIDAKPECYAFAGERKRMTETDVMAMVAQMEDPE